MLVYEAFFIKYKKLLVITGSVIALQLIFGFDAKFLYHRRHLVIRLNRSSEKHVGVVYREQGKYI